MTIGVLIEDVSHPFAAALHRAVSEEAEARGVQVITGSLSSARERQLAAAFARKTEGLILAPMAADQSHLSGFVGPVVFVDRGPAGLAGDMIVSTNVAGAAAGTRHLVAQGHRRIAYLGDLRRLTTARDRHRGYLRALGGRTGPVAHELRDSAAAERATIAMLRAPDPPTAIFAARHVITVGAVRALRRLGRQHEVALVGFDDFPLADLLDPPVTVVAQDPARIGRTAVTTLFDRMDGDKGPPREIRVPTTLIPRGSGEIPTGSW
ncbi:substrate-binding domain-containing protein [Actinoplanes sp. KI2]|uniref:substrate-binding domain-containing protein n=1 Tax=Actinoplanes sp. KI2 TaxID=2983315 RepID=UPI0021D613A7|nr:substrate-binding domain-containing protein [Actinoplanes sp. KI2]MCU7723062.1 substrate-binding domain-containing protein [Actinoplanes sp. KI2]